MSTINALAVLDLVISGEEWRHLFSLDQVCQSRAAVAELVVLANAAIAAASCDGRIRVESETWQALAALRAALAKVA